MNSLAAVANDPWSWNVDYLVAQICHSESLFHAAGCRPETFPDAAWLETQLRNQEITGATFLTALESSALHSELGVQNFGQRVALLSVIKLLRRRSVAYKQHIAMTGVQAIEIDDVRDPTIVQPGGPHGISVRRVPKRAEIVTVSQPAQGPPLHAREPPITTSDILAAVNGTGEWDYLLRWETAEGIAHNETFMVDNAIDEDDTMEEEEPEAPEENVEEAGNEEDQEMLETHEDLEAVPGRAKLSRDQITDIINERIEYFTRTWEPNKGIPKEDRVEYDAQAMFDRAEAAGERLRLLRMYKNDAEYYKQRLDKLCDEIMKAPGGNADGIRYQCINLEMTINSMLLAKELVLIYSIYTSESDSEEDDDEEGVESIYEQSSRTEHGNWSSTAVAQDGLPSQPQSVTIIDLGSPPESSQEEVEDIIVDSSPPPEANFERRHSSSPDRFHTPRSTIVDTVEPPTRTLAQQLPSENSSLHQFQQESIAPARVQVQFGDDPEKASIASARRWRWPDLVSTQDRKRIVTKALLEMNSVDRETIRSRLTIVGKVDMAREIPTCIRMLARKEEKMQGVLPRDMPKIITFTRLFLCWWLCDNYFRVEPSKWRLEELEQCLLDGSPDPSTFYDYLNTIMRTTFSQEALRHPEQPSQAEIIEISDDEDESFPPPATQRKTQVQLSQISQRSATIILD